MRKLRNSFLPVKPLDGKMRNVLFISQVLATSIVSTTALATTFIYLLVKWAGVGWWLMILPVGIIETVLVYVNYLARVRYKKYFVELNSLWNKLDRKSTSTSLLAHIFIVLLIATVTAAFCLEAYFFVLGFLMFNMISDMATVAQRTQCIKITCPYLKYRMLCVKCISMKERPDEQSATRRRTFLIASGEVQ